MQAPAASLIIAFYKEIEQLILVGFGLKSSPLGRFEVTIADNGSSRKGIGAFIEEPEEP